MALRLNEHQDGVRRPVPPPVAGRRRDEGELTRLRRPRPRRKTQNRAHPIRPVELEPGRRVEGRPVAVAGPTTDQDGGVSPAPSPALDPDRRAGLRRCPTCPRTRGRTPSARFPPAPTARRPRPGRRRELGDRCGVLTGTTGTTGVAGTTGAAGAVVEPADQDVAEGAPSAAPNAGRQDTL